MQALKIKVIKDWPMPINLKEVQGFLEYINFY